MPEPSHPPSSRFSHIRRTLGTALGVGAVALLAACQAPPAEIQIQNPYAGVDWDGSTQYKANLHTHTTRSDGRINPQEVVDHYHRMGYQILAITDHNEVTYPWSGFSAMEPSTTSLNRMESQPENMPEDFVYEDRDPSSLGILAIQANEVSAPHHVGSYFSDFNDRADTEEETLRRLEQAGATVVLFHPGRYTDRAPETYTDEWYLNQYRTFPNVVGIEIYNQGDRYPTDRGLWDRLLTELMPERPVWAYSNDDMHSAGHLGRNWNVFPLSELSHEPLRAAMEEGRFFWVYAPEGESGPTPPAIRSVQVDERRGTIDLDVVGGERIYWISRGDTIQTGAALDLTEVEAVEGYVRAEVWGPGNTITGTQPFGLGASAGSGGR